MSEVAAAAVAVNRTVSLAVLRRVSCSGRSVAIPVTGRGEPLNGLTMRCTLPVKLVAAINDSVEPCRRSHN